MYGALAQLVERGTPTVTPEFQSPPQNVGQTSPNFIKRPYGALAQLVERTNRTLTPTPIHRVGKSAQKMNRKFGALAQLVARYIRIVEVTGSNPVCSTTNPAFRCRIFSFIHLFCKFASQKLQVCKRCKRFDHNFDHNSKENIHLFHDIALRFHRRMRIELQGQRNLGVTKDF